MKKIENNLTFSIVMLQYCEKEATQYLYNQMKKIYHPCQIIGYRMLVDNTRTFSKPGALLYAARL